MRVGNVVTTTVVVPENFGDSPVRMKVMSQPLATPMMTCKEVHIVAILKVPIRKLPFSKDGSLVM